MATKRLNLGTAIRESFIVKVVLKPQNTEYKVHEAVLVEHSEYFRKALTRPWKEAEERIIKLAGVKDHTFDVFVEWLYGQTVPDLPEFDRDPGEERDLMEAYFIGDWLQAPQFKAAVIRCFIRAFNDGGTLRCFCSPSLYNIIYAFTHLPQDDIFLELLVDLHCRRYESKVDEEDEQALEALPHQFLVRVMKVYSKDGGRDWLFDENKYLLD